MRLTSGQLETILRTGHCRIRQDSNARIPVPAADLEQSFIDAPERPYADQAFNSLVSIHIHSRRHRLTDADGLCGKWLIDAIVQSGLLRDDSPAWVEEVRFSQEKIGKSEPETTLVEIREKG
jgi:hypothetical protein